MTKQEQANLDKANLEENNKRQAEAAEVAAANVAPPPESKNETTNEKKDDNKTNASNKSSQPDSENKGKSGYDDYQKGQVENAQQLLKMVIDFQKIYLKLFFNKAIKPIVNPATQWLKNEISGNYNSLIDRVRDSINKNSDKTIDKESTSQSKEEPQTIKIDNEIQQNKNDQEKNETGILADGFGEDIETLYNEKKTKPGVLPDGFGENIETLYEDHTEKTIAAVDEAWEKNKTDDKNILSEAPQLDVEDKNIPKN